MIIFHEGLPGSGKSYEAALNQIIPALMKGRAVYAYIEGLNRPKFAEITGLPLETVTKLLTPITKEQVLDVQNHVANDSLVVLDELQDFFPAGKATLSPGITEFVTQHRHRGIDIVCMGQDHRDCHMLWKRRIDTLIKFLKRDAIGFPNSYLWTTYKQTNGGFTKLRSGGGTYDKKYFGLYASHSDGVSSIDAHSDDRSNVLKSSLFKYAIPSLGVISVISIWYLWGFFHPEEKPKNETVTFTTKAIDPPKPISQPVPVPPKEEKKPEYKAVEFANFIEMYLEKNRPRLSAFVQASDGSKTLLKIDFYDGDKIVDTFNYKQFVEFGYTITKKEFGVLVEKNGKRYPITMWPRELRNEEISKMSRGYSTGQLDGQVNTPKQSMAPTADERFGQMSSMDGPMVQMAGPGL